MITKKIHRIMSFFILLSGIVFTSSAYAVVSLKIINESGQDLTVSCADRCERFSGLNGSIIRHNSEKMVEPSTAFGSFTVNNLDVTAKDGGKCTYKIRFDRNVGKDNMEVNRIGECTGSLEGKGNSHSDGQHRDSWAAIEIK